VVADAFSFAQNTIKDAEEFAGFDSQSGLFARFAHGSVPQHLADFKHASGYGPLAEQRRMSALDQKDAVVLDDNGTYTDQWNVRKFASHVFCSLPSQAAVRLSAMCVSAQLLL
jgi:hypothetical protein